MQKYARNMTNNRMFLADGFGQHRTPRPSRQRFHGWQAMIAAAPRIAKAAG
jgi:hypothetical protein